VTTFSSTPPKSNSTMVIPQTRLFYQSEVIKNSLAKREKKLKNVN
jgi:hypothetical protein